MLTTSSPEAKSSFLATVTTFPLTFIYCRGRNENNPLPSLKFVSHTMAEELIRQCSAGLGADEDGAGKHDTALVGTV